MLAAALAMTRIGMPDDVPPVTPAAAAIYGRRCYVPITDRAAIEAAFAADQEAEDDAALRDEA